jgi:hypothetical protein
MRMLAKRVHSIFLGSISRHLPTESGLTCLSFAEGGTKASANVSEETC